MYTLSCTIHRYPLSGLLGELRERWWADLARVKLGILLLACPLVGVGDLNSVCRPGWSYYKTETQSRWSRRAGCQRTCGHWKHPKRSTHEKLQSFNFVLALAREGMILLHSYTQTGRQACTKQCTRWKWHQKPCGSSTAASKFAPFLSYNPLMATFSKQQQASTSLISETQSFYPKKDGTSLPR